MTTTKITDASWDGEHNTLTLELQVSIGDRVETVSLVLGESVLTVLKDQVVATSISRMHNTLNSICGHINEIRKYLKPADWDQR